MLLQTCAIETGLEDIEEAIARRKSPLIVHYNEYSDKEPQDLSGSRSVFFNECTNFTENGWCIDNLRSWEVEGREFHGKIK
jgi:hypothetical protein